MDTSYGLACVLLVKSEIDEYHSNMRKWSQWLTTYTSGSVCVCVCVY